MSMADFLIFIVPSCVCSIIAMINSFRLLNKIEHLHYLFHEYIDKKDR